MASLSFSSAAAEVLRASVAFWRFLAGERAVADGRLLTSRGAGTSLDFALLIIRMLFSPQKAAEIGASIDA